MENLKIRVNNEAESKEAQELFVVLGAVCCSGLKRNKNVNFLFMESGFLTACKLQENFDKSKCKEITLPELRDLVVLKRNDVGDATHEDYTGLKHLLLKNTRHVWGGDKWLISSADFSKLKPIEKKEMKEYLMPSDDYKLIKSHRKEGNDWIEIPEGANFAWKSDGKYVFFTALEMGYRDASVVWSRHTHPEELPFIDDEPQIETATGYQLDIVGSKTYGARSRDTGESDIFYRQYLMNFIVGNRTKSLNDQYAEIEKVRQSAWQKQEGGNHYKNLKIQPMQYALENKLDYAQANVVKYVTRHKEKNGKEDLLKAIHNIELMIEFYYGDEK